MWDTETYQMPRELVGHKRWGTPAKFFLDGKWIATERQANSTCVGRVERRDGVVAPWERRGVLRGLLPDGKTLAVIDERDIRLYPIDFSIRDADTTLRGLLCRASSWPLVAVAACSDRWVDM